MPTIVGTLNDTEYIDPFSKVRLSGKTQALTPSFASPIKQMAMVVPQRAMVAYACAMDMVINSDNTFSYERVST